VTKFFNPESNETLKHRTRADGTRDLFVWKGDTTRPSKDHQHNVISSDGSISYVRDFNGRVIADDRK